MRFFFFFNDTATTEIYTLSLHDALPISLLAVAALAGGDAAADAVGDGEPLGGQLDSRGQDRRQREGAELGQRGDPVIDLAGRSEEHTSELQSRQYLVCRLLLEKKIKTTK